jgi:5'-nucleotidase
MKPSLLTVGLALASLATGCATRASAIRSSNPIANIQILAFNDFHGAIDPPTGSNGRIGTIAAGGVEYLAAHISRLKVENANTVVVSAGDNIGASPLVSGMFHDEPSIEALDSAGLEISAVGNHEFDEGWEELYRMQRGGCHPVAGCQDRTPFAGASFRYLSANVMRGAETLFPPTAVKVIDGVQVGFIGLALQGTPSIVNASFLRGLTFRSAITAGNEAAASLVKQGVKAIVAVIHEGGRPARSDINGCGITGGAIVDIADGLSPDIDVIVSGHSHQAYVCTLGTKLVTSAQSNGALITDIDLQIERATGEVVAKAARNVIVDRDIAKPAAVTALVEHYRPFLAELGQRPVGAISAPFLEAPNEAGESMLGDLIADAMLDQTSAAAAGGAQVALWNTGGIRADLVGQPGGAAGTPLTVTFAHAFDVLPFANRVEVRTVTGAALIEMLATGVFQVSRGVSYKVDLARPRRERVDRSTITLGGLPIDPVAQIRVATSDFIWNGGDGIVVESRDVHDAGTDIDLFISYLEKRSPIRPGAQDRITRKP